MSNSLTQHDSFEAPEGPVVLVIADGVGVAPDELSNAVTQADTPTIDELCSGELYRTLLAHGSYVGLPSDSDIGNSEVGHNAMGAGRIFDQGAKLVNQAIETHSLFESPLWSELVTESIDSTLHLIGLHSDGRVHSDITHLHKLLEAAAKAGVVRARIHILLDGRDTPERSALGYIAQTEDFLNNLTSEVSAKGGDIDFKIASGGGRMKLTMDRYEADWAMVKRGYECHTHGIGTKYSSATEAVETMYSQSELGDQDLAEFVICDESGEPVGKMVDGDVVVLFNFRGDRAIEISQAYEYEEFAGFERVSHPAITFMGLLQYDGDLELPEKFLVAPPEIDNPVSEYLCASKVSSFAVSETQKFGHVTFFWNGNKSGYVNETLEKFVEIKSDNVDFSTTPAMKAVEITDAVISLIESGKFSFGRLNYPNGDMIGHTGDLKATIAAMEAMDAQIKRLIDAVEAAGGVLVFTADHGNADVMYKEVDGKQEPVTSHTVNPVPFAIFDSRAEPGYELAEVSEAGLSNLASTLCNLLGFNAPDDYRESLIGSR